jgi:hypothetical protein
MEAIDPQVSWKPLGSEINLYVYVRDPICRTYVSPRVAGAMDLVCGSENIRGIAEIWEPHVLDVCIIECLCVVP